MRQHLSFLVLCSLIVAGGFGQAIGQDSSGVRLLSRIAPYWQGSVATVPVGNRLYVCTGETGLRVINPAITDSLVEVAQLETPGYAARLAVQGAYGCLADWHGGLRILNVANPSAPQLLATLALEGSVSGVALAWPYAYVAQYGAGMSIVDISIPTAPVVVGHVDLPSIAYQIEFQGSFVYIANYSAGLTIVDVSLPSQPEIVSTFAFSNWTSIIEVEGMRAYVNVFQDGYHIIDISDPGQPADIGEFSAGSTFTVSDNLAYCIGGGGFAIINVADASNPVTIGSVWGLFNPASLTLSGTTVIAAANGPLHFFDVSNPADPELEFTLSPPEGQFTDVDIEAGFAYVAEGTSGIRIVDWNNPIEPVTLSHTPAMEFCARVKVSNDLLFAMGYTGWRIYDIADRQNPILLAAVQPAIQTGDMALTLEGLVAFVSGADNVLRVWDVSDPAQPQVLGQLAESGYGAQIVLQDTLLYLADGSAGLRVINVADPAHPEQVGSLWEEYLGGAWSVAVQWPIAYVAFDYGLWSVDVQNPFQPLPVEEGMNAFMPEVCVADSHLFVGFDYYGLLIYDIRDPWNPEYVGLYSGDLRVSGLDVLGQHVAVAHVTSLDFYDAAEALPVTDRPSYPWGPDKFELQGNYPNPFNAVTTIAFAVPTPAVVSLRVFDLLGRQTAVLMDHAYVSAGLHQVQFDASQVASGIYLCSLEVGDIRQTRKMIVLK